MRAELRDDALAVASPRPRLSWQIATRMPGWRQRAYELELEGARGSAHVRVESTESVLVPWPFDALRSRERVAVRVRVWEAGGEATPWSDPLTVEAGLLEADDWRARFVGPAWPEDLTAPQPAPYLRRELVLDADVVEARLHITALGVYEAYVNGAVVGDHVLAPGWTSYDDRLRVQTFDVTSGLRRGRNAIGAILGDGWYRGRLGPHGGRRNIYGETLALLAQLEVVLADGTTVTVCTDESWRAATGPILASDLYDGETYDARLELHEWSVSGFDDGAWSPVRAVERDLETLVPSTGPPVRRVELVEPVAITRSPSGKAIVDFGQNVVGRLRIRVSGEHGHAITLRHAEILEDGELCVRPLRQAAATDRYVLRGGGDETWEPRFTFHGFRYAEVGDWPGEIAPGAVQAVVCHSDLSRTGTFECSDELVNRLHENVVWSMRGNFLDVPTDCAQRDERLGWTGDVQIFAPTALFLYDVAGFLSSWLADLAAEQAPDGRVPNVVPAVLDGLRLGRHDHDAPAAAWGDAAVIVPWTIYEATGDVDILRRQYDSMRGWVDLVERLAGPTRLWDTGFQYGDWLDPTAPADRPEHGQTDPALVATAYLARSSALLAKIAAVLGRSADATRYADLSAEVASAFRRAYVRPDGRLTSDSATAYAVALCFGLLHDTARASAGERLVDLVRANGFRISTGFVGTPLICDALCSVGADDDAYELLMQRECPSFLYPLTMGATTIWERWDSMLPDGSLNPGEMTSFNHYALGAVADWLHRAVAGLGPAAPAYRRIAIHPLIGSRLEHARASHDTPYGRAEVAWRRRGGEVEVDAVVPPNTVAVVTLPDGSPAFEVGSGRHTWRVAERNEPSFARRGDPQRESPEQDEVAEPLSVPGQ
ncbi:MAG: family 78 glycoside hydrolase catalytic domain [Gaiellaceae bacterium]